MSARLDTRHSKKSLRLWLRMLSNTTAIEKQLRYNLARNFGSTLPRFDVLAALDRVPAGLTMSELSQQLMVSNGNVTGIVKRLQDEGYVSRKPLPEDARTIHVRLTRKGQAHFDRMATKHESWIDDLFQSLTTHDLDMAINFFDSLNHSLEPAE